MNLIRKIEQWDINLFLHLNSFHNTFWDYCMAIFTTTHTWLLLYAVILFIIINKYKLKSILILLALILIITLADQGAGVFKRSVERLRPSQDPAVAPISHNFFNKGGMYGFVSAHASNAFGFAIFSLLLFRNTLYSIFILTWALLIAYTRVYLGVHYPADIICGGILGALIGWAAFRLILFTEPMIYSISSIQNKKLSMDNACKIIFTGIFTITITMGVIMLLINHNYL